MSKNIFSLFFLFSTFSFILNAQNTKIALDIHEQVISNLLDSSISHRDSNKNISVEICEKAIKVSEKEQADSLLALAFKTQGINYYLLNVDDSSMFYYQKAISKFKEVGDLVQVGKVLGNISLIYRRRCEYSKALEYNLKEIKIFSEINYTARLSPVYLNTGNISVLMNNYDRAEGYFNLALKYAEDTKNISDQIKSLYNLGSNYEKQNKFKEALKADKRSLSIVLNRGDSYMENKLYLNMGLIYRKIEDFDKAAIYLKKSFDICKLRGDFEELMRVYYEMFEFAFVKKEYSKAEQYIGIMQDLTQMNNDESWTGDLYRANFKLYKEMGDYRVALNFYEQYKGIEDTIQSRLNKERYKELMVKYDIDQTKQKMELMTQKTLIKDLELDKKNAWLIAMFVIMLLGIIVIVVSYRINKLKAEHKLMSLDQKVLLSQMNPHFLFNALTAVQSLILDEESDKANFYLSELGTLVRHVLEDSREEQISFRKELNTLEKYIDLQKLRFNYPLEFRFDIDDSIDLDELNIPPMLTQPFIENALVHANLQEVDKPEILIKIESVDDNFVAFSIQDNGIGIQEGKKNSHIKDKKSLAMQIVRDRIQIYNYKSKLQMKLDVIDLKQLDGNYQGTLARFTIPTQA